MAVRAGVFIACTLVTLALPWGAAVDPAGNDADSGADAGDTHLAALALAPGTYVGRVTDTVDRWDFYATPVQAGDLLRVSLEGARGLAVLVPVLPATGSLTTYATLGTVDPGREATLVMTETRTIYVRVEGGVALQPNERPYRFTLSIEPAQAFHAVTRTSGWAVAELRADEPTDVHYTLRAVVPTDAGAQPWSAVFWRESDAPGLPAYFGIYWAQTGLARTVRVDGQEVATVPLPPGVHVADNAVTMGGAFPAFQGHLRIAVFHTSDVASVELAVASRGPAALAATDGGDLRKWGNENAPDAEGVVAPGLSVQGPMETEWTAQDRFLGAATSWFRMGNLSGPAGVWMLEDEDNWAILRDLAGPWTLRIEGGETIAPGPLQLGPGSGNVYLAGMEVPSLGVAPLRLAGQEGLSPVCRNMC